MPTPSCPAGKPGPAGAVLDVDHDDVVVLDESFTDNPYPTYELLRARRPVTKVRMGMNSPVWLVTGYDDVRAGLADSRLAKDATKLARILRRAAGIPEDAEGFDMGLHNHMLHSDGAEHTRLRKLVSKAFTGRAAALLRPRIEALAAELADTMAARLAAGERSVDLIEDYAFPLPTTVICEILGVPDDRRAEFGGWSRTMLSTAPPHEQLAATEAMGEYLDRLVAGKVADPGADILSEILAPDENADRLTHAEGTAMASLLLVAGHETTVNLIGSGALALLRNPEQLRRLRANPESLPGAVEEFLRLESPVNTATMRFTDEEVIIGGTTIPAGEIVLLAIGSANRDPGRFERPDELDIERSTRGSIAFGHGVHYCLGAALGRIEGEVAFRVLLDRFPSLTLAVDPGELRWHNSILLRGLVALPVSTDG
ncbi:cytochrome P450 family protein [Amycolatopsis pittospori]|uniref:cytochrome P450 family protein n=1 Tax=Amycolatopsis pittospori TaxID=2749434 RepID=UPI0015F07856|nr:cytochrome P450 [Amycolatopsis pittospori]